MIRKILILQESIHLPMDQKIRFRQIPHQLMHHLQIQYLNHPARFRMPKFIVLAYETKFQPKAFVFFRIFKGT